MPVFFAIGAALLSAATFAAGSALQHRAAGGNDEAESGARMFVRLAKRKSWLFGLLLSAVAFSLHAVALDNGDLALVQPVIVSGIVFAVIFRAALDRHFPARSVLGWLALTWGGLALFLAVRPDSSTGAAKTMPAVIFVVVGVLVVGVAWLLARRTSIDRRRGVLLSGAAGILFGLVAGLLKMLIAQTHNGLGHALAHWSLWTLIVVGIWAVVLNQRAYQVARLSVTTPMLNVLEVLVAIAFGIAVFSEQIGSSAFVVVGELVGLAAMVVGVRQLAARQ